jgi:multiple sugar transport system permease protein
VLVDLHIVSEPVAWFTDAELGLWAVIASVTWKVIGFGMILFVAAIQSIDGEISEAAMIDGANYWQRVRRIILPLSTRSILLTTLISVVGSMVAFDQFYIMTAGGPRTDTFTSVYWMYQNSFIYFKLGYGSALAIILTLIIFAGAAAQVILTRPRGTA